MPDWVDLGNLADYPQGEPILRKDAAGRRYACVRLDGQVHALDDRCPHQGYPLSQGCVAGGVLTCSWHNWKFDLTSGECTFGGEAVRRYPTRVEGGRVYLDVAIDRAGEIERLVGGVRSALTRGATARALREALRLGQLVPGPLGGLHAGFELLARDGAERGEYGFEHGLAMLADLCTWVERGWIDDADAFVAAAVAIAEPALHLPARPRPTLDALDDDPAKVAEALIAERRDEAEARVRRIVAHEGPTAAARALLPFVTRHIWDYGHGLIFFARALELATRFPPQAEELLASVTVALAWATADTALPPFAATRAALDRLSAPEGDAPFDREALEAAVLVGERSAVEITRSALSSGADPVAILRAVGHAAAVRLSRFDSAWEERLDTEVNVLDITHCVTFAEAAIAIAPVATRAEITRLAVLAAAFVGKLRLGDGATRAAPDAAPGRSCRRSAPGTPPPRGRRRERWIARGARRRTWSSPRSRRSRRSPDRSSSRTP